MGNIDDDFSVAWPLEDNFQYSGTYFPKSEVTDLAVLTLSGRMLAEVADEEITIDLREGLKLVFTPLKSVRGAAAFSEIEMVFSEAFKRAFLELFSRIKESKVVYPLA
jgi:hypothetical protein